jgi:hypothetical protein
MGSGVDHLTLYVELLNMALDDISPVGHFISFLEKLLKEHFVLLGLHHQMRYHLLGHSVLSGDLGMLLVANQDPVDDVDLLRGAERPSPLRSLAAADGDALVEVWPELLLFKCIISELAPADSPRQSGDLHDVLLLILSLFFGLMESKLPKVLPQLAHLDAE